MAIGAGGAVCFRPGARFPSRRPPSFAGGVDQIRVSVSVTDAHDRYVDGLAETDFAVFEDGVPQKLSFFTRDPVPLSVALLIDASGSMEPNLALAQPPASGSFAPSRPATWRRWSSSTTGWRCSRISPPTSSGW